jgi:hypothetical protein
MKSLDTQLFSVQLLLFRKLLPHLANSGPAAIHDFPTKNSEVGHSASCNKKREDPGSMCLQYVDFKKGSLAIVEVKIVFHKLQNIKKPGQKVNFLNSGN